MRRTRIPGMVWSPEDEGAFVRWRRIICIAYGGLALILVAAWGVIRLLDVGQTQAANRAPVPPSASIVPAAARR
jgi:hypothetical protein